MKFVNGEEFMKEVEKGMRTIDITPKWEAIMQILVEILTNPKASTISKREAKAELIDLAKWVDCVNEERKKK